MIVNRDRGYFSFSVNTINILLLRELSTDMKSISIIYIDSEPLKKHHLFEIYII